MALPSSPPQRPPAPPRATPSPSSEDQTPPSSSIVEQEHAPETPRARTALRRTASSPPAAWTWPSPLPGVPSHALDSRTPPFVPKSLVVVPCTNLFGAALPCAGASGPPLALARSTALASSCSALVSPDRTPTGTTVEDPVVALGRPRTPFFMLAPQDDLACLETAPDASAGERRTLEAAGDSSDSSLAYDCDADALLPLFNLERARPAGGRGGAGLADAIPRDHEVNRQELSDVVATLDSRFTSMRGFANELYSRVLALEEASFARDGELHALRAALASRPTSIPAMPRRAPPPFPSPFPHAFPDGSYWPPDRSGQHQLSHRSDDLTPPASPILPRARAPLSRQNSHTLSQGGRILPAASSPALPAARRTPWLATLHSSPLDTTYFAPAPAAMPHEPCYDLLTPYPTPPGLGQFYGAITGAAPFTFDTSSLMFSSSEMLNEQAVPGLGPVSRESHGGVSVTGRSVSLADLSCSTGLGGGGGASMGTKPSAFRALSVSVGGPPQPRPLSSLRTLDSPNYRLLLETDADIDHEAFVRRILYNNDQQCSLFLQQRVRGTTPGKRQDLFEAVRRNVLDLSVSKFGNFLVSRCLEAGDSALEQAYEDALTGHFLQLSLDSFGCHVVQKLLDCGGPATKNRVIEELLPHSQVLMTKSSLHVVNRILTTPNPPAFFARLADMGAGLWASIVKDDGGSLVVQHMLEDWPEACASGVAREILDKLEDIARSPCGSFVVSHLLDRNTLPFCTKIMQHAPRLACDPFGAKIVDRCLRPTRAGPAGVSAFIAAITAGGPASVAPLPLLLRISAHAHGAQLVANLLAGPAASAGDKDALARCVLAHEGALVAAGGAGAARVVAMCRKALVVA